MKKTIARYFWENFFYFFIIIIYLFTFFGELLEKIGATVLSVVSYYEAVALSWLS